MSVRSYEERGSFKDWLVWQKSYPFTLMVCKAKEEYPKAEMYSLTSQFRRASVSITANIAEGYKKKGIKDKLRFYHIAQESLEDCRYYIILSKDLKDIDNEEELNYQIEEAPKLLNSYCRSILNSLDSSTSCKK